MLAAVLYILPRPVGYVPSFVHDRDVDSQCSPRSMMAWFGCFYLYGCSKDSFDERSAPAPLYQDSEERASDVLVRV